MARFLLVRRRVLGALTNPVTRLAPDDKVGRVGEVVDVLKLLGEFPSHVQNFVVICGPLGHINLGRVGQVQSEGDPVIMNTRVKDNNSVLFAFTESVNS